MKKITFLLSAFAIMGLSAYSQTPEPEKPAAKPVKKVTPKIKSTSKPTTHKASKVLPAAALVPEALDGFTTATAEDLENEALSIEENNDFEMEDAAETIETLEDEDDWDEDFEDLSEDLFDDTEFNDSNDDDEDEGLF